MRRLFHIIRQRRFHPDISDSSEYDGSAPVLPPSVDLGAPISQQGPLFRLPGEIRAQILEAAFAGHFVHINLLPVSLLDLTENPRLRHWDTRPDAVRRRHKTWGRERLRAARLMVWRGCVCERVAPDGTPALHSSWCAHGEGRCANFYRGEENQRTLEAMSFLLSCRQGWVSPGRVLRVDKQG